MKFAEKNGRERLPRGAGVSLARRLAQHVGARAHGLDRREDGENSPIFAEITNRIRRDLSVSFMGSDAFNSPSAGLRDYGHHPQVGLLSHTCISRPADEHRWRDAGEASRHCDNHISTLSSYSASNFSVRARFETTIFQVKEQLTLDPDDATPVTDIPLRRLCAVTPGASILDLLNLFQVASL